MSCERRWERWRVKFLVSSKDSTGPPRIFPCNSLVAMQGPTLHCSYNVCYLNISSISGGAQGRSCTRLDGKKHFRGSLCAALTCESQSCSSFTQQPVTKSCSTGCHCQYSAVEFYCAAVAQLKVQNSSCELEHEMDLTKWMSCTLIWCYEYYHMNIWWWLC